MLRFGAVWVRPLILANLRPGLRTERVDIGWKRHADHQSVRCAPSTATPTHSSVRRRRGDGRLRGAAQARDFRSRPRLHGDGRNFLSTVVTVVYPTLHETLSFSLFEMGVFLWLDP